jgi:hypothetical protein
LTALGSTPSSLDYAEKDTTPSLQKAGYAFYPAFCLLDLPYRKVEPLSELYPFVFFRLPTHSKQSALREMIILKKYLT